MVFARPKKYYSFLKEAALGRTEATMIAEISSLIVTAEAISCLMERETKQVVARACADSKHLHFGFGTN